MHFKLERQSEGKSSHRRYYHVIVDPNGVQYGPTFGDTSGPREAKPWLDALEEAFKAGKVARDMELRPQLPKIEEKS